MTTVGSTVPITQGKETRNQLHFKVKTKEDYTNIKNNKSGLLRENMLIEKLAQCR